MRLSYLLSVSLVVVACTPAPAARTDLTSADARTAAWAERVRPHLESCLGTATGRVRVRVLRTPDGKLAVEPEAGFSLDPTEQRCVLQALLMTQDPTAPPWTGASAPPMGSTPLFSLDW